MTRTQTASVAHVVSGGVHRVAVLHAERSADVGLVRTLGAEPLLLGRESADHGVLALHDARVSRRHARIDWQGDVLQIEDLGSRNGTFVDGERVVRAALRPGSVIRVGSCVLLVQYLDAAACARLLAPRAAAGSALVGSSPAMAATREAIALTARSGTVLIVGETGVGKELVAQALHDQSGRKGPLVPVNCAALPANLAESELFGHTRGAFTGAEARKGLFGRAEGGTLFLDEIGELGAETQAKLLRALAVSEVRSVGADQGRTVDVRIIAATNVDLETAVASGKFRADLFARLQGHVIYVSPLRERREDILELALHFLAGLRLTANAAEALLVHDFPYNVRELEQAMTVAREKAVATGMVDLPELPERLRARMMGRVVEISAPAPAPQNGLLELRRDRAPSADELWRAACAFDGNVARVASFFGKDRRQVYRWAKALGVDLQAARAGHDRAMVTLPPPALSPLQDVQDVRLADEADDADLEAEADV
jgi:DNA-binding NtrC family response regulator